MSSSEKGSFTVEAALIFPIIILALAGLILAFLLMYQKILLTKTAVFLAAGAAGYPGGDKLYVQPVQRSLWGGEETFSATITSEIDLGLRTSQLMQELGSGQFGYCEREFKKMQLAVCSELERKVYLPEETSLAVSFQKGVLTLDTSITITQKMRTPFGLLELTGKAKASKIEATEYIRNIDLALEYAERLKKGLSKSMPDFRGSRPSSAHPKGK